VGVFGLGGVGGGYISEEKNKRTDPIGRGVDRTGDKANNFGVRVQQGGRYRLITRHSKKQRSLKKQ